MARSKNNFEAEMNNFENKQPGSSMRKIFWMALTLVIVVLFIAGAWLNSNLKAKKYSVVYLSTGETYIGRLHTFPKMFLTDTYRLDTVQDLGTDGQPTIVQKLVSLTNKQKSWASDKFYLNRDQIVFHGFLSEGTEADKAIKAKVQ
ncbi:MAG: hypothetical protein Q8P83_03495 [bacterium]|nr:hypothetical protein [bacterium]